MAWPLQGVVAMPAGVPSVKFVLDGQRSSPGRLALAAHPISAALAWDRAAAVWESEAAFARAPEDR